MRNMNAENIEDYIVNAVPESQATMLAAHKVIKAAVPQAEEVIAWGMPCYKIDGYLLGYLPFAHHLSFGLIHQLPLEVRKSLYDKGYKTGNKSFQILYTQEIPAAEIKQMLQIQIKLNQAKKATK